MKQLYILLCLSGCAFTLHAQNKPVSGSNPAAVAVTTPAAYTGPVINYIRTWEPAMQLTDPAAVAANTDVNAVRQATQYIDGQGRPLQTVVKGISPLKADLVTPVVYDAFGREQYQYLPYVQQGAGSNNGEFKTDAFNAQRAFYEHPGLNPGVGGQTIYYQQQAYETSPLNRLLQIYNTGNTWAKEGGNKPVEQQYKINIMADTVRIWAMPATGVIPVSTGVYAAGQLYKNITKDERGMRVVEFKDKTGRAVLRKVETVVNSTGAYTGWLSTYYVYDDAGNLRCVIAPKAVELIKASWVLNTGIASELCFLYSYDERNRMIMKKVPGGDSSEMVYDVRDRLVFTRDGNMRKTDQPGGPKWLTSFYDNQNRPVMSALYNNASSRSALQTAMNTAASNTQTITHDIPALVDLVLTLYDGQRYTARNSITLNAGFETGTNAEMVAEIDPAANQATYSITVSNPLPNIPASDLTPLSYTFYDDYSFAGAQPAQTGDFTKPQATSDIPNGGSIPYPEPLTTASSMTNGLITGSKVRVLGTDQWLSSTIYYNDKGMMIQVITDNISGGRDISTMLHDFNGKLLSNYMRHTNQRSSTSPQTTMLTMNSYDHGDRLVSIKKRLNDAAAAGDKSIAVNSYDELGRLKTKRLGITSAGDQLETLNYEYNIRGWMGGVNKAFVNGGTGNWFGEELSYDSGFTVNQYNGNLAGVKWKSGSNNISRAYGYLYDGTGRLTSADFTQQNMPNSPVTASWVQDLADYTVNGITYDANGNIGTMMRRGMIGLKKDTIDQLTYTYQANSNKLITVADPRVTTTSKLGDFINGTNTGNDYNYDPNGNLIQDLNKNISAITYNHLNLPELITVTGKGTIRFQYDATGKKLRKVVTDNTGAQPKITTTDYIDGFVYQNDTMQFLAHEEGRIRPVFKGTDPVAYYYDYFVRDHLGNVRAVLTEQTDLSMYAATMETEQAPKETALFSNLDETRVAKPAGYPQDQTTPENKSVARLNAKDGGKKVGPAMVLRVMAGDTVQIGARAFYKSTGTKDNRFTAPEEMVASLLNAFGGVTAVEAAHGARQVENLSPWRNFNSNDYQRMKERAPSQQQPDRVKAYLSYALFDDQFNLVEDNSGMRQVKAAPDELQTLSVEKMVMKNTGFLYVYTTNETQQDVFFDNVVLTVAAGPLLEETHYYPYGLTMVGISNNAVKGNYAENKFRYNFGSELHNKEFADGSGLELYETPLRGLDPQLGRWLQIDSKPHEMLSPYVAMANNPVLYTDPGGDTTWVFGTAGQFLGVVNDNLTNQVHFVDNDDPNTKQFNASSLSAKDAKKLGQAIRSISVAFMGSKTSADLKAIERQSAALGAQSGPMKGKELAFVGRVGADKEIRLTAMPEDESNHWDHVDALDQIAKNYPSPEEQAAFFLWGHAHHRGLVEGIKWGDGSDMAQQKELGKPTDDADYSPLLYRNAGAGSQGQSPALIATPYGVTIYGTGTHREFMSGSGWHVKNQVTPSQNSYILYQSLKK